MDLSVWNYLRQSKFYLSLDVLSINILYAGIRWAWNHKITREFVAASLISVQRCQTIQLLNFILNLLLLCSDTWIFSLYININSKKNIKLLVFHIKLLIVFSSYWYTIFVMLTLLFSVPIFSSIMLTLNVIKSKQKLKISIWCCHSMIYVYITSYHTYRVSLFKHSSIFLTNDNNISDPENIVSQHFSHSIQQTFDIPQHICMQNSQ